MMATRYIGNCQICEGDQKLKDGRMVHHGYARPGHGYIVGDCPGVHHVPYEVSCDLVKGYLAGITVHRNNLKSALADLVAGRVTRVVEHRRSGFGGGERKEVVYVKGESPPYEFERALERRKSETESNIRMVEHDMDRCARRIRAWKPMPIRTFEEEKSKQDAVRAERAAVVAEKRAVRQAEAEKREAKKNDLAQRREAIIADFVRRFHAIAEDPNEQSRKLAIRAVLNDLGKKKHNFIWGLRDLKCDVVLRELGLAKTANNGYVEYEHYHRS